MLHERSGDPLSVGSKTVRRMKQLTENLESGKGFEGCRITQLRREPDGSFKKVEKQADGTYVMRTIEVGDE